MASLKDVAALAGVSPSTVSYFLNGKKQVKPETMEKIQTAIRTLDYHPNVVARSLKMKVSKSIGIVVSDLSNLFYPDILSGIESVLAKEGYSAIVSNSRNDAEVERKNLQELINRNIDGVILLGIGAENTSVPAQLNVPVIMVDRINPSQDYTVSVDNYQGGYLGARYLLQKGHRNIIFIGFHQAISSHDRYMGCLSAYEERSLSAKQLFRYVETGISPEEGYSTIMRLLSERVLDSCDAIFASADYIAVGVLKALHDLGFSVPQDIAVMGFDDLPLSRYMIPPLTTVSQPRFEMGQNAARMILDLLANRETEPHIMLRPNLVIRTSA